MRTFVILISLLLSMSACQTLAADEEMAQMEADLEFYATEAVQLRDAMQVERTAVVATIAAGENRAAQFTQLNRSLAATRAVVIPPTQGVVVVENSTGPMPLEMFDLSDGQMRFVQIGVAGTINASDSCWISHQTFFNVMSTQVIYLVTLALNLQAGTTLNVAWNYNGTIVHQSTWTAPDTTPGRCVALPLRPTNAPFETGDWTATLRVNGQPLDPAPFTISGM